jgi:hypothetical protein
MTHPTARPAARALAAAALTLAAAQAGAQTTYLGTGAALPGARSAFLAALQHDAESALATNGTTVAFGTFATATLAGGTVTRGYIDEAGAGANAALTLTFDRALTGFGGDFAGLGTCCGNSPFPLGTLRFTFYSGATQIGTAQATVTAANSFFGAVTTFQFDRVELRANQGDAFTIDNLAVGANPVVTATPEPGTWALLATGLAGVAGAARRRRVRTA